MGAIAAPFELKLTLCARLAVLLATYASLAISRLACSRYLPSRLLSPFAVSLAALLAICRLAGSRVHRR
eukprot:2239474-Prymnesium_polylepis.1